MIQNQFLDRRRELKRPVNLTKRMAIERRLWMELCLYFARRTNVELMSVAKRKRKREDARLSEGPRRNWTSVEFEALV